MKRSLSCLLLLAMLLSLLTFSAPSEVFAAGDQPASYSDTYNSGTRDVVCTTLSGTGAADYYTGNYTYANLSGQIEDTLLQSLRKLMTDTHKKTSSYNDCRDMAVNTDCQNGDGTVVLLYTSYVSSRSEYNGWNREHVWPQSLGGGNTSGGGADLHHIRPSDAVVNSTRGNKKIRQRQRRFCSKRQQPRLRLFGWLFRQRLFRTPGQCKGRRGSHLPLCVCPLGLRLGRRQHHKSVPERRCPVGVDGA